jgi:hypothetical protein
MCLLYHGILVNNHTHLLNTTKRTSRFPARSAQVTARPPIQSRRPPPSIAAAAGSATAAEGDTVGIRHLAPLRMDSKSLEHICQYACATDCFD